MADINYELQQRSFMLGRLRKFDMDETALLEESGLLFALKLQQANILRSGIVNIQARIQGLRDHADGLVDTAVDANVSRRSQLRPPAFSRSPIPIPPQRRL